MSQEPDKAAAIAADPFERHDAALRSLKVTGFRALGEFEADFRPLQVIVGANGVGKTSLFQLLRLIQTTAHNQVPPTVIDGPVGQVVFHRPGPDLITWAFDLGASSIPPDVYRCRVHATGEIAGPVGSARDTRSGLTIEPPEPAGPNQAPFPAGPLYTRWSKLIGGSLSFDGPARDSRLPERSVLFDIVDAWQFVDAFAVAPERSAVIGRRPPLRSDASNLAAVFYYLQSEHPSAFAGLVTALRSVFPRLERLDIRAAGAPGEVMVFWADKGTRAELTLADLADGTKRLMVWLALLLHPNPPPLICIDEIELGLHPRVMPLLAGLLQKASARTQIMVATHSSYLLSQFEPDEIAVMHRDPANPSRILWSRPSNSKALPGLLAEFGSSEIEALHRDDALEYLP